MKLDTYEMRILMTRRGVSIVAAIGTLASAAFAQRPPIIGPQVRVDVGNGTWAANENSAAAAGLEVVGTANDWRRSPTRANEIINMSVMVSNNAGQSWTDFLVRPPQANQSNVEGDPMAAYDARTGTLWVGAISFASNGGVYVARKNAGQNTFQPSVMARATGSADKCWMAAGRNHTTPNSTNLYITYNQGVIRSTDMGQTWSSPIGLGSGIGFQPYVGPNGEVYVQYWDFSTGIWLRRSLDSGQTWSAPIKIATRLDTWGTQDGSRGPGTFRKPPMNTLAVDPLTGKLYCVYFDTTNIVNGNRNLDLYLTTSTNQGSTWSTPKIINSDANPPGDQMFPWLEVDRTGRLHLHFFDTRNTVQNDGVANGMYDNYYAYSDDGGATWSEVRLTPNSWNCNDDGLDRGQQFLGDYSGLATTSNFTYPCYTSTQNGDPDTFMHTIINRNILVDTFIVVFGTWIGGGLDDLNRSDDVWLKIRNGQTFLITQSPITLEVEGAAPWASASEVLFRFEGHVTLANLTLRMDLTDWTLNGGEGDWVNVDQRPAPQADTIVDVNVTSGAAKYVRDGDGRIKGRLRIRDDAPAFLASWELRADQIRWSVTP